MHDLGGRVSAVAALLAEKGYKVQVYQEPRFRDCNLHMVYAARV